MSDSTPYTIEEIGELLRGLEKDGLIRRVGEGGSERDAIWQLVLGMEQAGLLRRVGETRGGEPLFVHTCDLH